MNAKKLASVISSEIQKGEKKQTESTTASESKGELFSTRYDRVEKKFYITCLDCLDKQSDAFKIVLKDSYNGLTNYCFDITHNPGGNFWFITNGWEGTFNGFTIQAYEKETGKLVFENKVEDFLRTEKIIPKVLGKEIFMSHTQYDQSSWYTFYEVFQKKVYEDVKPGDVVLDIGANLGFMSLYAIDKGASKVFSVEPDPTNFSHLLKNTESFKDIIPLNSAVSDSCGEIDMYIGDSSSVNTTCKENEKLINLDSSQKIVRVKSVDPNTLIRENKIDRIDYLKIDCEGAEYEFLEAFDESFLRDKVKFITGEVHAFAGSHAEYEKRIKEKLVRCGFMVIENANLDTSTELLFKATKRPKIKVVHLLNDPNQEREAKSIKSLKGLEGFGISYEQIVTPLYTELPPKENCNRPLSVSEKPGDYLLGPGHYGCYLSHKKGITEGLEGDFDAILLNECDSILQFSHKEMTEKIYEAYDMAIKHNLAYVSFGKKIPAYEHTKVSEDFYLTDTLSEAHCILIPKIKHEYFKEMFEKKPWDVSDLWYNTYITQYKKGIYSRPYSLQYPSLSKIDMIFKDGFILHEKNNMLSNFENNDVSVVIQTFDGYEFLWRGWYLSFKENWDWKLEWPVYFCNESATLPFRDKRINNIKTGIREKSPKNFSGRLEDILKNIPTKYVLYMQDDMWLKSKVDGEMLKGGLYLMKHFGWNSLKVHEKIWFNYSLEKTNFFVRGTRILKYQSDSEYLMTHNAAIWDKEFLLSVMESEEDPWQNEFNGTTRITAKEGDHKIYHLNMGWYHQTGIQQSGKFTEYGNEILNQMVATENDKVKYEIT
jgi:FkbM family methyltransferase